MTTMELSDYRLKYAIVYHLKAFGVNVGRLCKRDMKMMASRQTPEAQGKVFGVPLVDLVKSSGVNCGSLLIPKVMYEIAQTIRENLSVQGLFRVNGSKQRMKSIQADLDGGAAMQGTVHDQTGLLKQWLRDLPDPLFTYSFYEAFVAAFKLANEEYRKSTLLMLCLLLPKEHLHLLSYLFQLLHEISIDEDNRMTAETLASILTPNILRPLSGSRSNVSSTRELANHASCVGLVCLLIQHAHDIGTIPLVVVNTASDIDDVDVAERKFNKLMAGRRRFFWSFCSRGIHVHESISERTLNILKQSEKDLQQQHSPSVERRGHSHCSHNNSQQQQPPTALQYGRVLQVNNDSNTDAETNTDASKS